MTIEYLLSENEELSHLSPVEANIIIDFINEHYQLKDTDKDVNKQKEQ